MSSHSKIKIKNDFMETEKLLKDNTNKIIGENKLDALANR